MTTAIVSGSPGDSGGGLGEEPLTLTSKDPVTTSTTTTTAALNGTTEPLQSPDSAIGGTPPTATPDQEFTTNTTTTTNIDTGRSGIDGEELKETPEMTSSDEEGYEEDDEGGVEEEELTDEEEEEEGEEQMVVSASIQFPLAKKAAPPEDSPSSSPEPTGGEGLGGAGGGLGVRVKVNRMLETAAILKEASPSGCESDIEDNDQEEEEEDKKIEKTADPVNQTTEKQEKAPSLSTAAPDTPADTPADAPTSPVIHLPDTVTRLDTPEGSAVYLVGTAHFSRESQEDVASTIRAVKPDVVVVELCKARTAILQLDEETILQESRNLDLKKIQMIVRQHGKIQGVLYLLLLSVSAHITKQLGMAPGGEFRTAFAEARRSAPGCLIQLGDRPIQVTLSRALASLSLWHKIKLTWHILTSKEPISKEEVEKCKQRDFILEMLAEMTGQFPAISEVFVKERDIYLCRSLQVAALPHVNPNNPTGQCPRVVVGVVGIGHVPGIVELWGKVTEEDIAPIMKIPPPTLSSRLIKLGFRASLYGLLGYGMYRCLPRSAQSSIQSTIHSAVQSTVRSTLSTASAILPSTLWRK